VISLKASPSDGFESLMTAAEFRARGLTSARYKDFVLVGHGKRTSEKCGHFLMYLVCDRTELHNRMKDVEGVVHEDEVFVRRVHNSCDKPTCPVCYKMYSWREARNIDRRLKALEEKYGEIEHIILSVDPLMADLVADDFEGFRRRAIDALIARRVIGGVLIFHGFRVHDDFWFWSPHVHVLGFIRGGYGGCRGCKRAKSECQGCTGFLGRSRRMYEKDKFIVKVAVSRYTGEDEKRESVLRTARYQLGHAAVKLVNKRFHVATYFGVASYRKVKVPKVRVEADRICPVCKHDLNRALYHGREELCTSMSFPFYKRDTWEPRFDERGRPNWEILPEVFRGR
jgi:hypothetical protein